eukprot:1159343-Pelagomonas_calceolata.AAC.4
MCNNTASVIETTGCACRVCEGVIQNPFAAFDCWRVSIRVPARVMPRVACQKEDPAQKRLHIQDSQKKDPAQERLHIQGSQKEDPARERLHIQGSQKEDPTQERLHIQDSQKKDPAPHPLLRSVVTHAGKHD